MYSCRLGRVEKGATSKDTVEAIRGKGCQGKYIRTIADFNSNGNAGQHEKASEASMKYIITAGGRIEDTANDEDEALSAAEDIALANPKLTIEVWTLSSTIFPK